MLYEDFAEQLLDMGMLRINSVTYAWAPHELLSDHTEEYINNGNYALYLNLFPSNGRKAKNPSTGEEEPISRMEVEVSDTHCEEDRWYTISETPWDSWGKSRYIDVLRDVQTRKDYLQRLYDDHIAKAALNKK